MQEAILKQKPHLERTEELLAVVALMNLCVMDLNFQLQEKGGLFLQKQHYVSWEKKSLFF